MVRRQGVQRDARAPLPKLKFVPKKEGVPLATLVLKKDRKEGSTRPTRPFDLK